MAKAWISPFSMDDMADETELNIDMGYDYIAVNHSV